MVIERTRPLFSESGGWTVGTLLRLLVVFLFDAGMLWLIRQLIQDGSYPLVTILSVITLLMTAIFTLERFKTYRWLSAGLALTLLFVIYPILYTVYISTTNTGHGHVLTEQQAVEQLQREQYVPDDGQQFTWTAFQAGDGSYALWLQAKDGGTTSLVRTGETITAPDGIGTLDDKGIPLIIDGYKRLEKRDVIVLLDQLGSLEFGAAPNIVRVTGLSAAAT
ncbi:MAG TPA: hypothetical protein VHL11_23370, partial [Phototrophicaceae bacterium]|nr:hypothetical protein [Phototrophicaceae bacterium]